MTDPSRPTMSDTIAAPAPEPETVADETPRLPFVQRLASVDAYRGFVMFLMMAEVLHFAGVARTHKDSPVWTFLAHHQEHVEWVGCSLHDMIQPSFSFLVGVALPFSILSRRARGQSPLRMSVHAFWRAFLLVALGIFLRSTNSSQTNFTFEDTLTQIGLGYGFLFLLGFRPVRDQWIALGLILVGYWAAFALYAPGTGYESSAYGVPKGWPHLASGFAAHWNKNANPAWAFDRWFLNLFPRQKPFEFNGGGYATLSFIPTLGTMILGLIAGGVLRQEKDSASKKVWTLIAIGVPILVLGWGLGELGVCPVVKRIWTPSWVLFSGGICFLMLAAFYTVVDLGGLRPLFFPLIVIGMNSIAAYCMSGLIKGFIQKSLTTHLGRGVFDTLGHDFAPTLLGASVLLVLWLILFWMYRRRIFLRI
jgi:predicted acyltransferase